MVFFSSALKAFSLMVYSGLILLVLSFLGFIVWPAYFHSMENWIILFLFGLCVILSVRY